MPSRIISRKINAGEAGGECPPTTPSSARLASHQTSVWGRLEAIVSSLVDEFYHNQPLYILHAAYIGYIGVSAVELLVFVTDYCAAD